MSQEKINLLHQIHNEIIEKYRKADVPMIFKTADCGADEWYGINVNTNKVSKLKFFPSDMGTKIVTLESE